MERNCRNCGAPLDHNRSFCEYCGTPNDNWLLIKPPTITITPHNMQTLKCGFEITKEMVDWYGDKDMFAYAKREIARRFADELVNCMDLKISQLDPMRMTYTIMGRIRVLNESARFTDLSSTSESKVRCKDCKWKQGSECVRFADVRPNPDDFCSRGERREYADVH